MAIRSSAASKIQTNKMKKDVAVREATRMKLVQQLPDFQSNPLSAIRKHLEQMTAIKQQDAGNSSSSKTSGSNGGSGNGSKVMKKK
jgi:hypothetical protein